MKFHKPDFIILAIIGILIVFGLIMISSASISSSQENFQENYHYVKKQIINGLIPGLVLAVIGYFIPYGFFKKLSVPLLALCILGSILVLVPGIGWGHGGANRWIQIGGSIVQPSEFLKLAMIIYLAAWFSSKGKTVKNFHEGFVPFIFLTGMVGILLIAQPDFGTMGVIALTALIIYFLAGASFSHIGMCIAGGAAALLILIKTFPHAYSRLSTFLNPASDPLGDSYQINQALVALGSGGFFGLGLGQSIQKHRYLPEPAGDSIAAVIGEELGFIGLSAILILFLLLFLRGLKIFKSAPDQFGALLAGGIASWFLIQALVNIAANCNIIPLTGITLPFFSLGGSSLTATLAGAGILLNVSKHAKI
ncbi:MAG: Stage V sporulation protein E (Required for spore cortex synthesis) [Parcubacteria group bacterium GW2011_GWA1_42_7]|nr:MAG: Stage V sporulation protein E (Required for spore cortex synthesis) [Parcubacteria group bacterium GW2011_GWB1_42_6]KKS70034.1 MAG: Stage V sporulation protein E (Required for spore cortex synthesis) [Parcubacteria group bacterium GW2011_GWA1_42_7]KKS91504.1 MAG: cell division membrane protein, cell division protein FtsW [Parcubacteria group bacterium GW2011_GWC1_43_12]